MTDDSTTNRDPLPAGDARSRSFPPARTGATPLRLARAELLARLTDDSAPRDVLLEAPAGYGKSALLHRAAPPAARAEGKVTVIDDAHALDAEEIERLIDALGAPRAGRLLIAGRLLPDTLLAAADEVDALVLGWSDLAVGGEEIAAALPAMDAASVDTLVGSADGSIGLLAQALGQRLAGDPASIVHRQVREAAILATGRLSPSDRAVVDVLARAPGLDRHVLGELAGAGFVERAVTAGVPVRRHPTGGFDIACAHAFRASEVNAGMAVLLAEELTRRDRPLDAVQLLLDARLHDEALARVTHLPESIADTVEPRTLLGLVGRFGALADSRAELLLLRAAAHRKIGRLDAAGDDVDKAMAVTPPSDARLRRRVSVEVAERVLIRGHRDEAVAAAEEALGFVGAGEDHTSARALGVLAEAASTYRDREHLQRAADCYLAAAHTWDACGEHTKARGARCSLVTAALVPLGRFDEALVHLGALLSSADLSITERAWLVLIEGFVLQNANRLATADAQFVRATELGHLQDNPRLMAAAAWGRALISAQRDDLPATLRWIATAENTALGDADDVLGVPFMCDMATALGALGELNLADDYLARASERPALFPDQLAFTRFVLDCRHGRRPDAAAQLRATQPSERWRVQLVAAGAAARAGDVAVAERLHLDAQRDLVSLGFSDFAALGEGRAAAELRRLLEAPTPAEVPAPAVPVHARPRQVSAGPRLLVLGGTMAVRDDSGLREIPGGNPQRLVGAVVARGGAANLEQLTEAIWPDDAGEASRARLRNVLLRVRRAAGDILVRSGAGIRLARDVTCDLLDFARLADDALAAARADPVVAGELAREALDLSDVLPFADFEYEEWTTEARRAHERRLLGMLDLLSVQAEDDGDLPMAQHLAERALRLDRYSDSRYVRLAELLAMQGRSAAAAAVLDDAAAVAREISGGVPQLVRRRRDELLRQVASSE